jgi:inositol transporter-like SP family MFS transporter
VLFFAAGLAVGLLSSAFPILLNKCGTGFVGTLLIGFLTLAAIIGAIWAPETGGKTLQQIEAERYAA